MIPQGWTIGRIGGIAIKIHISLIVIGAFVTYTLAARILPFAAPKDSSVVYWVAGLITSIIFIGSILWHEMAHSVVAQHYHIPVAQIVLHLFGGVAQITREPERPAQEFWIAIAGPLASLALAILFGAFSMLPASAGATLGRVPGTKPTFGLVYLFVPGLPPPCGGEARSVCVSVGRRIRH